jgi:TRAP transporter TAXI family solute receptor
MTSCRKQNAYKPAMARAASVLVFFLAVGCGGGETHRITLSGGSMGGGWSAISEGVVGTLRREMPDAAITQEIGLDGANAAIVNSGRVQLGLLHSAMGHLALQGAYPYSEKLSNLQAISLVYADSAYHFVVRADTGLTSMEEIKEKKYPLRVSVIYKGSLMELASQAVFEAYGFTYQDIESWGGSVYFRAVSPSIELMKDNRLDAVGLTVQFPETNINEGSLRTDFRLLPLSDAAIEFVNRRLGTYRSTIPGGTYRFAPDDIPTFSDVCVLTAYAGLPEQEVYEITRALFNNLDYLHTVHRSLAKLRAEDLPRVNQLPLHPGAERFYREAGLL